MAVVDTYSSSNYDNDAFLFTGAEVKYGQSFSGTGNFTLTSCSFYLRKEGTPPGNMQAEVYAHTGTFGGGGTGTGSVLATSVTQVADSVLTTSYANIIFTFSGANQITLTNGTRYVVNTAYAGGDVSNRLWIGRDASSPTHQGNQASYVASWAGNAGIDIIFTVNGDAIVPVGRSYGFIV